MNQFVSPIVYDGEKMNKKYPPFRALIQNSFVRFNLKNFKNYFQKSIFFL